MNSQIVALREWQLEQWFKKNFSMLGFSKIERINVFNGGDYFGWRDGQKLRIELETTPTQFFLHKPKMRNKIDIILCWRQNMLSSKEKKRELSQKEVIVTNTLLTPNDLTWLNSKEVFERFAQTKDRSPIKILQADESAIVLLGKLSKDYRFSIPEAMRGLLTVGDRVKVTIEKVKPK